MEIKNKSGNFFAKWFQQAGETDLRSLALMRILLGLILIFDLGTRALYLKAHYSDAGMWPRVMMKKIIWEKWFFSIHALQGDVFYEAILFILAGIFALAFLLGFKTRLFTFLSWMMLVSLQNRNQLLLNGGDQLLRMILFWCMFLPTGKRFSMDSFLHNKTDSLATSLVSVASLALLFQEACMYFFSGYSKIGGLWMDGKAMSHAAFMSDLLNPVSAFLFASPAILTLVTYITFYSQLILPFFLFIPIYHKNIRMAVLGFFLLFHFFILLFFRIGIFPWVSMACTIGLMPDTFFRGLRFPGYKLDAGNSYSQLTTQNVSGSKTSNSLALFFLIFVFEWNLLSYDLISMPRLLKPVAYMLRIDQKWNMFRTESMTQAYVVEINATNTMGTKIDVDKIYDTTLRWRNFMYYMPFVKDSDFSIQACRYICADWNAKHFSSEQMVNVEISVNEFHFKEEQMDSVRRIIRSRECQ